MCTGDSADSVEMLQLLINHNDVDLNSENLTFLLHEAICGSKSN